MSPTARTLAALRRAGYLADVVERFLPYGRVRRDLFGCIDILAVRDGETLGVQATSADHVAHRLTKLTDEPLAQTICQLARAGWQIEIHGWRPPTKSRRRWNCRRVRYGPSGWQEALTDAFGTMVPEGQPAPLGASGKLPGPDDRLLP